MSPTRTGPLSLQLDEIVAGTRATLDFGDSSGVSQLGADELATLVAAGTRGELERVTSLSFRNSRLPPGAWSACAQLLLRMGRLGSLDLYGWRIGDAGIRLLCDIAAECDLGRLGTLNLGWTDMSDDGLCALADARAALPALGALHLEWCAFSIPSWARLGQAISQWESLRLIGITRAGLGADQLRAMCEQWTSPHVGLEALGLDGNQMGASGIAVFGSWLAAGALPGLRGLSLRDCSLREDGGLALVTLWQDRALDKLTAVDLTGNWFGPTCLTKWIEAAAPSIRHLTACMLGVNHAGRDGCATLAKALKKARKLIMLGLEMNALGEDTGDMLGKLVAGLSQLRHLNLYGNELGDRGVSAFLSRAQDFPPLETLNLGRNGIGAAGARAILSARPFLDSLTHLVLSENNIRGSEYWDFTMSQSSWMGCVDIGGTPGSGVPESELNATRMAEWERYWDEKRHAGKVRINMAKVVVLGEAGVGKTHLCRRLVGDMPEYHNPGEPRTHNIEMSSWRLACKNEAGSAPFSVRVWDFGGQHQLHATHRMFLSDQRCLCMLVCDAQRTRDENRIDYWLGVIRNEASARTPVVVVVTKCDLIDHDGEHGVRRLETLDADELRQSARLDQNTSLEIVEGIGWSQHARAEQRHDGRDAHRQTLDKLRVTIAQLLPAVPDVSTRYPAPVLNLLQWVETNGSRKPFITMQDLHDEAKRLSVPSVHVSEVVALANNLGIVHFVGDRVPFKEGDAINDVAFNPAWVRYPAYIVIRDGRSASRNGLLTWEQLRSVLPEHAEDRWSPDEWGRSRFGSRDRARVVDLMVACEVMFEIRRGTKSLRYFVPDHLRPRGVSGPPAGDYVWRRDLQWMSEAAFGRLLGRLHQQATANPTAIWRDEITVSTGTKGSVTVRLSVAPSNASSGQGRQCMASMFVAVSGHTEDDSRRIVDQIDAELRAILLEPAIGESQWVRERRDGDRVPSRSTTESDTLTVDAILALTLLQEKTEQSKLMRYRGSDLFTKKRWFEESAIDRHPQHADPIIQELVSAGYVEEVVAGAKKGRRSYRITKAGVGYLRSPSTPA